MTIAAYPLAWPTGWKRTMHAEQRTAKFGRARQSHGDRAIASRSLTMAEAVERVLRELQHMAVGREDVVISTNVRTRLDGLPRGDQSAPGDVGVAVYWEESAGARRVMAIDQYDRVEDNLAAIAATLDAMRAIERHGGALILERAFTGFTALPAPGAKRSWREVLGIEADAWVTKDMAKARYRTLAGQAHPDRGGSDALMSELNAARDAAMAELKV